MEDLDDGISSREHSWGKELSRKFKWGNVLGPITLNRSSGLILLIVLRISLRLMRTSSDSILI